MTARNVSVLRSAWRFGLRLSGEGGQPPPETLYSANTSVQEAMRRAAVPLVPDVSIHYRCGDNVVTHYGFLPFKVYSDLIAEGARTIYVMSEHPSRKTNTRRNSMMMYVSSPLAISSTYTMGIYYFYFIFRVLLEKSVTQFWIICFGFYCGDSRALRCWSSAARSSTTIWSASPAPPSLSAPSGERPLANMPPRLRVSFPSFLYSPI